MGRALPPGESRGSQLLRKWRGGRQQKEACEALGIDPVSYHRFEKGIRRPSARLGFEIERATRGTVNARAWYEAPKGRPAQRAA